MKTFIAHSVKALGTYAILGVSVLSAQGYHKLVTNVPFDFNVADKHLNAGTYTLTSNTLQSPILIRGQRGSMFILPMAAKTGRDQRDARLVFRRYGDRYFLATIWYSGTEGRQLNVSKAEQQIARNASKPEQVAVLVATSHNVAP